VFAIVLPMLPPRRSVLYLLRMSPALGRANGRVSIMGLRVSSGLGFLRRRSEMCRLSSGHDPRSGAVLFGDGAGFIGYFSIL